MESTSIGNLFEVGHFLYQLQSENDNLEFSQEIEWVLDAILENLGVLKKRGRFRYVVNTDCYEKVMTHFFKYCRKEISKKELVQLVTPFIPPELDQVVNGQIVGGQNNTIINTLFELKYAIQINRLKQGSEIGLLRAEKRILNVILEELSGERLV